ncbi:holin [Rhodococcus koreensis]
MTTSIYTAQFWKDAGERTIATGIQTLAGFFAADQVFEIAALDWREIGLASLTAAGIALLKAIAAALVGVKGSASLTKAVVPNPYTR